MQRCGLSACKNPLAPTSLPACPLPAGGGGRRGDAAGAAAASRVGLTCGRATAIGPLPVPARASPPAAIGRGGAGASCSTAAVFQFSTAAARPVVIRGGSREGR
jgi:hypothetical protein